MKRVLKQLLVRPTCWLWGHDVKTHYKPLGQPNRTWCQRDFCNWRGDWVQQPW